MGNEGAEVMAHLSGLRVIENRWADSYGEELVGGGIRFGSNGEIATWDAKLTQLKQYVGGRRTLRHGHLN